MKTLSSSFLLVVFFSFSCTKEKVSPLLLLDAKTPTDIPLIFAKGIISTNNYEFAITFSPEMDEIFFTRRKPGKENEIYSLNLINGTWSNPQLAFFSTSKGWDFEPHINPKGDKLYFGSTRTLPDSTQSNGLHQWYSTKTQNGWSNPIPLESPFIEKTMVMYLTSSTNENLYFTTGEKDDKPEDWVIYTSIKENGHYKSMDRMSEEINSAGKWIAHSFIAPDESYMIYDFKSDLGFGGSDLYISFNLNQQWSEPFNLGPKINTDQTEMATSVSPDGNYLFFHRGFKTPSENSMESEWLGDIYWVDFQSVLEGIEKNISERK